MNGGSITRVLAFCQGLRREYCLTVATRSFRSSLTLGIQVHGKLEVFGQCSEEATPRVCRPQRPLSEGSRQTPARRAARVFATWLLSRLRYGQMAISLAPRERNRPSGGRGA